MAHDGSGPLLTSTAALSRVVMPPDASAPRGPSPLTWVAVRRFAAAVLGAWIWAGANGAALQQPWWWAGAALLGALAAAPSVALAARRRSLRTRATIFRAFCEATLGEHDPLVASTRTVVDHAGRRPSPREILQLEARLAYLGELLLPALAGRSIAQPLVAHVVEPSISD